MTALILVTLFYTLTQICFGTFSPWARLLPIPVFFLFLAKRDLLHRDLLDFSRSKTVQKIVLTLALILTLSRLGHIIHRMNRPIAHMEDIAILNTKAISFFFGTGENPYAERLDPTGLVVGNELRHYDGYKYPPLGLFFYAPFTLPFGLKGIYLGNLLCYALLILLLVYELKRFSPVHAGLGVILFLTTDFFFTLSFNKGINDFLPTLLILGALLLLKRGQDRLSGPLLGASLLSKQFPGALLALFFLIQKKWRPLGVACLIFLMGALPFFLWGPRDFWANVVEFQLLRPVRETSLAVFLPPIAATALPFLGILFLVGISHRGNKVRTWNLSEDWTLYNLAIFIFLITSKMSPAHYFVWIIPTMILWYLSPPPPALDHNRGAQA